MPTRRHLNWLRLPAHPESPAPFDDFFSTHGTSPWWRDSTRSPELRVDITEDDTAFCIRAEVPGVDHDDIDVLVQDNRVVIHTEARRSGQQAGGKALVTERSWGKAYRAFVLPSAVDGADAGRHCAQGILTLILPKKADTATRAKAPGQPGAVKSGRRPVPATDRIQSPDNATTARRR